MDLSVVKPEEIVHVDENEEVLSITHMPDYYDGNWFIVVTRGKYGVYRKNGRYTSTSSEPSFKFKDEEK